MKSDDAFVGPVNLGNPAECTIKELAHLTIELTGSKSPIEFRPLPEEDPKETPARYLPRQKKTRLGATVPLRDGLIQTIEYFRSIMANSAVVYTPRFAVTLQNRFTLPNISKLDAGRA